MNTLGDNFYWDQDILNSLVDGNYLAIEKNLINRLEISKIPDKDTYLFYSERKT